MCVVNADTIDKLRARFGQAKLGKRIGRVRIHRQNLAETATPDPAEEFENEKKVLLLGPSVDEDRDPCRTNSNAEDSLTHGEMQSFLTVSKLTCKNDTRF
jgi:hypothetical protein